MKNTKGNATLVVLVLVAIILAITLGGLAWFVFKKNQALQQVPAPSVEVQKVVPDPIPAVTQVETQSNNQGNEVQLNGASSQDAIDPKAQTIIDQIDVLRKKRSPEAESGKPSDADMQINEQISELSKQLKTFDKDPINLIINAKASGYELSVTINGKQTGVNITKSGSVFVQLFNSDSIWKKISTPEMAEKNFVLNRGENTIAITYKRIDAKELGAEANVEILAYDQEKVLTATVKNSDQGTIEKTFTVATEKPADFKTITIEQ
jgi:hypothetical protein